MNIQKQLGQNFLNSKSIAKFIVASAKISKHDIVWIRMPSPISKLIFKSKNISSKKIVCFLAGDIKKQSDSLLKSKGIKKILYKIFINNYINFEKKTYKKVDLLYYYSADLLKRFNKIKTQKIPFRTPVISNSDIDIQYKKLEFEILFNFKM